jgi:hypothetical protein
VKLPAGLLLLGLACVAVGAFLFTPALGFVALGLGLIGVARLVVSSDEGS